MKKLLKKEVIIAFLIGIILASSIAVYAANISAKNIDYKDGKTVEQALNELYSKPNSYVALFNEHQYKSTSSYKLTNNYINSNYGYINDDGDFIFTKPGSYKIIGTATDGGQRGGGDVYLHAYLDETLLTEGEYYSTSDSNTKPTTYSAMDNIYTYTILNQTIQVNENSKLELSLSSEWNDNGGSMSSTVVIIKL